MGNLPTPPAPAPKANHIGNVSPAGQGRSAYWGMGARETAAAYFGRLRSIKAQGIALILANAVAMILFDVAGHPVLYIACLVCVFAVAAVSRVRMGKLFMHLLEVVTQDCDPARYRAVLEGLSARDRLGRSANSIAIELAYCDYLELDSASALRRLQDVTFKRKDNPRWFRAMQIEFMARLDLGDMAGARDTLARLSAFRTNFKEGSRNRIAADAQVSDFATLLRSPAERDTSDAARMRERSMLGECHQQRANWQLYLAEYELLHGSREEAARLAGDSALDPLTPRMERLRAEILEALAK